MTRAVALWGARIPCGGTILPAAEFTEFPAAVQITMAAIDPTSEPQGDGPKRATLKIIRRPMSAQYPGYDSEDDSEEDSEDDEEESEDEKPKKGSKKAEKMDVDSDKKAKKDDDDEESDSDEDEDGLEIEEFVLCTLDAEKNYQQPLVITMNENEEVYFRVVGSFDIFLTGNYIVNEHDHDHDEDSEEDEDYDLSPSEDEFDFGGDSEDDLDDLANPRIQEVDSEDEAPKLSKKEKKALKRSADDAAETSQKKQKGSDGKPVAGDTPTKDKKVKFAKNLEQGPTPSPAQKKDEAPKKKDEKKDKKEKKEEAPKKAENKTRVVNGVTIVDAVEGSGPQAKNGQKISVRYIGKLQKNGKQFDANVSGKPFSFTLGKGEVIKGWDIGMAGMRVGGARTLTIPPNLAYANQSIPGIPKGSTLVFEVKCLGIK